MPRKNRSEEKRAEILKAYERCLNKGDISNITIRKIAEEAGVPLGSIHYYFKDKTEIILTYHKILWDQYVIPFSEWSECIDPEISTAKAFFESFINFVHDYYKIDTEINSSLYSVFYYQLFECPELRKSYYELNKFNAELVAKAIQRTKFKCNNPLLIGYLTEALLDGFSLFCEMGTDQTNRDDLFSCLDTLFQNES